MHLARTPLRNVLLAVALSLGGVVLVALIAVVPTTLLQVIEPACTPGTKGSARG